MGADPNTLGSYVPEDGVQRRPVLSTHDGVHPHEDPIELQKLSPNDFGRVLGKGYGRGFDVALS
jgi:hypothetical protein